MPHALRNTLSSAFLPLLLLVSGCSNQAVPPIANPAVTGNWQFSSTAAGAAHLSSLSGTLTGTSTAFTGTLHADGSSSCTPATTPIAVTGSTVRGTTTLTGALAGGTLSITGKLATSSDALDDASYTVSGGTCAFVSPAPATGQMFSSIDGSYAGSFSDPDGVVMSITATLTQTPSSDADGNFQLSGTGTFGTNPCFISPVAISGSQVTGGSFTVTYTDPVTTNSVTTSGTFTPDGNTLSVTGWTLTGPCGPDSGTGQLTKQAS
jgi:hypothetical protein